MLASFLVPTLAALGLAAPLGGGAEEGALAAYLPEPDFYAEVFDLDALEGDLADSGLGRVLERFGHLLDERVDELDLPDAGEELLGLSAEARAAGVPWTALVQREFSVLLGDLGLDEEASRAVSTVLGSRSSFAWSRPEDGSSKHSRPRGTWNTAGGQWILAWSLRPGGDALLTDVALAGLHDRPPEGVTCELLELSRDEERGVSSAWRIQEEGQQTQYVVVRPDLVACTPARELARKMAALPLGEARGGGLSAFQRERREALVLGHKVWAWGRGSAARASFKQGRETQQAMRVLGIDEVRSFSISMASEGGQLASRVRIECEKRRGALRLLQGGRSSWGSLELLTSDTLLVAGMPRSALEVADDALALAVALESKRVELLEMWQRLRTMPHLGEVLSPEVLAPETLFFVRPGPSRAPLAYLALRGRGDMRGRFQQLEKLRGLRVDGIELSRKKLDSQSCWMLSVRKAEAEVVICEVGGALVVAESTYALQDYLRQRARERLGAREDLIAALAKRVGTLRVSTGHPADELAGFVHVRTRPLMDWAWPYALFGLTILGVENLEDFPDSADLASELGDTTVLLFADDAGVELRGWGLLGGLALLF